MAAKSGPNLAEIYAVLNQLVEEYGNVMTTFQTVIAEVGEIKAGLQELRKFVNEQFADAISARDVWQHNAQAHKAEIERLKTELQKYQGNGAVSVTSHE